MNDIASRSSAPPRRRGSLLRLLVPLLAGLVALVPSSCGADARAERHPLILISFDGFRWDYPDRGVSPNLEALADRGVRAEALIPSFPTKTFPNHYTMVTGLVPDRHGMVANTMWDPEFETRFSMSKREEVRDARWWGGEPVWVTAERRGLATAPLFWPGSEAAIAGVHPTHWLPYDGEMTHAERVDWVLELLDFPPDRRPVFLTLYFAQTDEVGHVWGPESARVDSAVSSVDRALGRLVDGLAERGMTDEVNLVVVSDHGMIATSRDRVIFADDYVDLDVARPVDWNPVLALWPDTEDVSLVYDALKGAHPEMAVYLRYEIPADLRYGAHPRTPPILGIATPGWSITSHEYYDQRPDRFDGGNHGYDPAAKGMHGVFVAAGPDFRRGVRVPALRNVHVYSLIMAALDLPPAESDGDLDAVPGILAR